MPKKLFKLVATLAMVGPFLALFYIALVVWLAGMLVTWVLWLAGIVHEMPSRLLDLPGDLMELPERWRRW